MSGAPVDNVELDDRGLPVGGRPFKPEWETTPREVKAKLDSESDALVLIDCRRPEEHEHCRIESPNQRLVPMHETWSRLKELSPLKDKEVVVYCHTGRRSLWVAAFLRQAGFKDVKSMAGGIDVWSIDIDSSVPRY
jgi:rhodanese-related sulfurtransferase